MASSVAYARERERVLRICDAAGEARTLRLELLEAIRRVVGFDAYAWLVTDPETAVGCAPLADVPCLAQLPQLIRLRYLTTINRWTALPGNVALLAGATGGDLSRSPLWRDLLRHYAVSDIASSVHRDRFGCWGFLDLWRAGPAGRGRPRPSATAGAGEVRHAAFGVVGVNGCPVPAQSEGAPR